MASRRNNLPPTFEERFIQESEKRRRGSSPAAHHPLEPLPHGLLENKYANQVAEIQRLTGDNQKLASSHLVLRQNLLAAAQEVEKLREYIGSLQTEGDIQIRILLGKIAKMEADVIAGDNMKKELHEAHVEAHSLLTSRQELIAQIQQATEELEKAGDDVKNIPEMRAELDSLRQEHQRLRNTFEYEKGVNIEKVGQMKIMEKDLIAMAGEVERLQAEVSNAEKRAATATANVPVYPVPQNGPYMYPPHPFYGNGVYMVDAYGVPHPQMVVEGVPDGMNLYAGGYAVDPNVFNGAVVAAGNPTWGVAFDPNYQVKL